MEAFAWGKVIVSACSKVEVSSSEPASLQPEELHLPHPHQVRAVR